MAVKGLDDGDVWVVGGSMLESAMLECGAMHSLALFVIPVLLGGGVPLSRPSDTPISLALESVTRFDRDVVGLTYRCG